MHKQHLYAWRLHTKPDVNAPEHQAHLPVSSVLCAAGNDPQTLAVGSKGQRAQRDPADRPSGDAELATGAAGTAPAVSPTQPAPPARVSVALASEPSFRRLPCASQLSHISARNTWTMSNRAPTPSLHIASLSRQRSGTGEALHPRQRHRQHPHQRGQPPRARTMTGGRTRCLRRTTMPSGGLRLVPQ